MALASALEKIDAYAKQKSVRTNANLALSTLYIINPFRGSLIGELFSTHPSTQKRIARLEHIAETMGIGRYYPR
jgi:heat shock protein HtpX